MPSVLDVAQYILKQKGSMSAWKLQKLVYYSQAWSLVWDEKPIFPQKIEAWANGPVVRELYDAHRGLFTVHSVSGGNSGRLNQTQKDTVDAVLKLYGAKPAQWLSDLTHKERPWREAREKAGLAAGERGNAEITVDAMYDYYGGLK